MSNTTNQKKIPREIISHIVTGLVVILKGIDKIGYPEKLWLAIMLILIGGIILSIGVFHHQIEPRLRNVKALVFICEGVVMGIVGYIYMHDGKSYIQYVCFVASIGFLVATLITLFKKKK